MIKYPLYFKGNAKSKSGIATSFETRSEEYPPITCAIPKEFNGPGGGYAPEELYGLAVLTCLIATFKFFAEKSKVQYEEINGETTLTVDRDQHGMVQLLKLDLTFTLTGVQDEEKARKLLGESEKYCLVSNAVKSEKTYKYLFI